MNSKCIKFCGIFIVVFFFNSLSYAQDSSEINTDSATAIVNADSLNNDSEEASDTVVNKMIFTSPNDSLLKWKRSPEFGYMGYLDSLLKKNKNDLRIDTINIDGKAGRSESKSVSNSSSSPPGILNSFPVKIFFWLIAIFFIGFILYRLFFKGGLFERGNVKIDNEPIVDEPEKLNEYSAYNDLITEAESKNDFNLAVRYLYLQSLKKLSDAELILFSPDKTNKAYVQELDGRPYQFDFASLTLNYEYIWYGKFAINRLRYQKLKDDFILFNKKT
ncbi:MAG TPA: hypothetical protein VIJ92_03400 [Ginsengibacter sp.]